MPVSGHRDKVIAAALTGAVVIVVGYASGIGLRTDAAASPAPVQPPAQAAPPANGLPAAVPPPAPPEGFLPAQPPAGSPSANYPVQPPPASPQVPHVPPPGAHPPGHQPSEPPNDPPSEPAKDCEDGAVRSLVDMLLPAGALPLGDETLPLDASADDEQGAVQDTLDALIGYCEPAEEPEHPDEGDEHDGHGG